MRQLLTLFLIIVSMSVSAQSTEVTLGTEKEAWAKIDIMVKPLEVVSGGEKSQQHAEFVEAIIADDFRFSGLFNVITDTATQDTSAVSFAIEGFLEGRLPGTAVTEEENAPLLTLKLVTWPEQLLIFSKRYRPMEDKLRTTAHHFSNEVITYLTMEPSICMTRLAFTRGSADRRDLYCIDYDGANLLRLTANRTLNLFPAWSPDGSQLAFMSYREGQQGNYLLDTSTGRVRVLSETVGSNLGPSWHPDGTEIIVSLSKTGQHEIYRLNMAGRILRRLTISQAIEVSPEWSPTGNDVVFTSDRSGSPQLYIMGADGSGRHRLTFEGKYNDSAAWSPNGDNIVYACREKDLTQIVMIKATGEDRQVLTDRSWRNCEDPRWAPDGRHIVFASDKSGVFKLYVMDVLERSVRQLTFGGEPDTTPDWSH
ncbi:MAG: hypothetical protein GY752_10960 [bacterium]|nr:hypothetical protein [bacterium]